MANANSVTAAATSTALGTHWNQGYAMALCRRLFLACSLLFLALSAGCSTYRDPQRDVNQYECEPGEPTDPRVDFKLLSPAFMDVSLTAQGALVDRCQWTAALHQIDNYTLDDDRPKIILMHIHGWKHNSDPQDTERARFAAVIDGIDAAERARGANTHVVGIFVSWPALTMNILGLENLTFFSRTTVADRISQAGIVGKLIGAIESITTQRKASGYNDVFIMMGYSLGARILFNATSQAAIYQSQLAYPHDGSNTYGLVDGPGDLVMLLNPAISAGNYTAIDSIRRSSERFSSKQSPVFLTISTDNDKVTSLAFPLGHIARFDWDRERRTALGEYRPYITHTLARREEGASNVNREPEDAAWYDDFCAHDFCLTRLPAEAIEQAIIEETNSQSQLVGIEPDRRPPARQTSNPFIVAKSTSEIIDGHGGFWSSDLFSKWLGGFIERTLNDARNEKTHDNSNTTQPLSSGTEKATNAALTPSSHKTLTDIATTSP